MDAAALASLMLEETMCYPLLRVARRLLDVRLDHLEEVEDRCDAILDGLRATEPAPVVDAIEAHYIRGESWSSIARRANVSKSRLYDRASRVLARLA